MFYVACIKKKKLIWEEDMWCDIIIHPCAVGPYVRSHPDVIVTVIVCLGLFFSPQFHSVIKDKTAQMDGKRADKRGRDVWKRKGNNEKYTA